MRSDEREQTAGTPGGAGATLDDRARSGRSADDSGGAPARGLWVALVILGAALLVFAVLILTSGVLAG